jgi:hypothetical protein
MINKIDFKAKKLISNAGLFLLLEEKERAQLSLLEGSEYDMAVGHLLQSHFGRMKPCFK